MILLSGLFLILLLILILIKNKRYIILGNRIPGPWSVPLIGNMELANLTPEKLFHTLNDLQKKHDGFFRLWLGPNLWIFLSKPEAVETILNNKKLFKPKIFDLLQPLIGNGLLISKGFKWHQRRKAINSAFCYSNLKNFINSICDRACILVEKIKDSNYQNIDITPYIMLCTLDIICDTAMGVQINCQEDPNCPFVKAFNEVSHILFKRMANPLLQFDFIFKLTNDHKKVQDAIGVIHDLTDKVIEEKRKNYKYHEVTNLEHDVAYKKRESSLLDALIESRIDGIPLSNDDIREEVNTFLFAGIDTTKSAIIFLLYNIAKYDQIQDKIFDEIVLQKIDLDEQLSLEKLDRLKVLDLTIKESLRYHTTVPVTAREVTEEIDICGYLIPKTAIIWINIYGMSHDQNIFPNPYQFDLNRFEHTQDSKIHRSSYIPYSSGPHICIGRKYSLYIIKAIAVKLLLNFRISLAATTDLELISEMVLKSKKPIHLNFESRSKQN